MRRDGETGGSIEITLTISTHAPRVRRDLSICTTITNNSISTHAPRVRRDSIKEKITGPFTISTHAPRVRRDAIPFSPAKISFNFYSRASCEARLQEVLEMLDELDFYSRASCEARRNAIPPRIMTLHFYSRASCEARHDGKSLVFMTNISTHAPRVRRDRGGLVIQ